MTVLYLETSALLSWLFNESDALKIIERVNRTDLIVTSVLIRVETVRAINRALNENLITEDQHKNLIRNFEDQLKSWFTMSIDDAVLDGASKGFPVEPERSLDAIHLATALEYKKLYPELKILSLDNRIIRNAEVMGMISFVPE